MSYSSRRALGTFAIIEGFTIVLSKVDPVEQLMDPLQNIIKSVHAATRAWDQNYSKKNILQLKIRVYNRLVEKFKKAKVNPKNYITFTLFSTLLIEDLRDNVSNRFRSRQLDNIITSINKLNCMLPIGSHNEAEMNTMIKLAHEVLCEIC